MATDRRSCVLNAGLSPTGSPVSPENVDTPAHPCDREHGSEPKQAQDRAHGLLQSEMLAAESGSFCPAFAGPKIRRAQKNFGCHSFRGVPLTGMRRVGRDAV